MFSMYMIFIYYIFFISGPVLDLSNQTLDVGTCAVVGKMIQVSSKLEKVTNKADAYLSDQMYSIIRNVITTS